MSALTSAIEKAAPLLATALLGPAAGVATSLLENLFHVSAVDLPSAIESDPESFVKIKQLEMQYGESLANINATNYAIAVSDRKDAREKNINGKYEWFIHFLAFTITLGFFSTIYFIFMTKADNSDRDILNMLLGVLGTAWVQVCAYYFGGMQK